MKLLALLLTALLSLAACGSAGTTATGQPTVTTTLIPASPSAAASSAPPPSAATTPLSTVPAGTSTPALATTSVPPTSIASTPTATIGDDVDLASLLPTQIAGMAMTIEPASDPAGSFLTLWSDEQTARNLLQGLGATPADVSIVYSYPTKNPSPDVLYVDAYRVARVDGMALAQAMANAYLVFLNANGYPPQEVVPLTVEGKSVLILRAKGGPPTVGVYYYPVGHVVFSIHTDPPDLTDEALKALP